MQKKLLHIINKEDKKNPLTDEQCAKKMSLNRSEVTQLRKSLGIPDSRDRRKPLLKKEIEEILSTNPDISERKLTKELKKLGFEVSRFTVSKLLEQITTLIEKGDSPSIAHKKTRTKSLQDPFTSMIGWDKSLKIKVEQAKAAVLYPPNGLHTLIVGATGVGKSELAEVMYQFALQVKGLTSEEFPFVVFNCADYAENPQLLLAQLYGYKKGAFTGADIDKEGLIAKADGGILFLDEVHRLPPEGQEILFQIIDKGKYRKLGETNVVHDAKVKIIAATTEDIEKNLLGTFRRRIPMVIELPPLDARPFEERLEIIKLFFRKEAARINKKIFVDYNTMRALLVYDCVGNIGQLKSDIQVTCARGFLKYVAADDVNDTVTVDFACLPIHITKGLLNSKWDRGSIEKIISDDIIFLPNAIYTEERESIYDFSENIYKTIEDDYQKLQNSGLSNDMIEQIIGEGLEAKVKKIIKHITKNKDKLQKQDLSSIVKPEVISLVQDMTKRAKSVIKDLDDTFFYCMATHLNTSVDRIKEGKPLSNPYLDRVKTDYPDEYGLAKELSQLAGGYLGLELPEEEIGFIAMYLRALANSGSNPQETIGIVIVTHGNVAQGMANVANMLLGVDMVRAVEMSLDESPDIAFERTLETVSKIDKGKGVLILVDMGSLAGFGNLITKKTGIITRTITRVDTLMVVDAVRKVLLPEADIDQVAESLVKGKSTEIYSDERQDHPLAVLCLCLTGEGTAKYIAQIIDKDVHEINEEIKLLTLGVLNDKDIGQQIDRIRNNYNLTAIVGTVDVAYPGVPFISYVDIIKGNGKTKLKKIIRQNYDNVKIDKSRSLLFSKELILLNQEVKDKCEALKVLGRLLERCGKVSSNFLNGVIEREKLGPALIENHLAIPHGFGDGIIEPCIGIMTLKNPVDWYNGIYVSAIFMLALDGNSHAQFQKVYNIINDFDVIDKLKSAKRRQDILDFLQAGMNKQE